MKPISAVLFIAATLTALPFHSDPTDTCAPAPCAVQSITPHPSWTGKPWISHVDSGANATMLTVPNGTVISFFEHFTIGHVFTAAPIRFAADDSASLWVNGSPVQPEAPMDGNAYTLCSDFGVTCTSYTEIDIAPWLSIGENELRFDVAQRGRYGFGVAWMGEVALTDIGDPPVATPEPGTASLLLMAAALFIFFCFVRTDVELRETTDDLQNVKRQRDAYRLALERIADTYLDSEEMDRIAREALEDE